MEQVWEQMKTGLQKCERCGLCRTRTQAVWGVGNPRTKVLLIGEAPGKNEDEQGEPFVGRSGQLLDKMLAVVDLDRKRNIYITNIVKCRPPENRDPAPEEVAACLDYLLSIRRHFCAIRATSREHWRIFWDCGKKSASYVQKYMSCKRLSAVENIKRDAQDKKS